MASKTPLQLADGTKEGGKKASITMGAQVLMAAGLAGAMGAFVTTGGFGSFVAPALLISKGVSSVPFVKITTILGLSWMCTNLVEGRGRVPKIVKPPGPKKGSWLVPIGKGENGWVYHDFAGDSPHVLIAGTTGSGKSQFMLWFLHCLCRQQSPYRLRIDIIDLKGGATFAPWINVPHVNGIYRNIGEASAALAEAEQLMWERLDTISECRRRFEPIPDFPHRFVLIDEGSLLAMHEEAMETFQRIAAIGREPRIHLIYGAQRPENTVLPLIIRDQLGARFCFKVDEPGTSEMMLGRDNLRGYELPHHAGRLVYRRPNGKIDEVQAVYLTEQALEDWLKSMSTDVDEADTHSGKVVSLSSRKRNDTWGV